MKVQIIRIVGNAHVEIHLPVSSVKTAEKLVLLRFLRGNVNAVQKMLENSVKIVENLIFLNKNLKNAQIAAGNRLKEGLYLNFVQTAESNYKKQKLKRQVIPCQTI